MLSDKERQGVVQRVTTNEYEWQRMTTSGTMSDNEWHKQWQRVTTSGNEWLFRLILNCFWKKPTNRHPKGHPLNLEEDFEDDLLN